MCQKSVDILWFELNLICSVKKYFILGITSVDVVISCPKFTEDTSPKVVSINVSLAIQIYNFLSLNRNIVHFFIKYFFRLLVI